MKLDEILTRFISCPICGKPYIHSKTPLYNFETGKHNGYTVRFVPGCDCTIAPTQYGGVIQHDKIPDDELKLLGIDRLPMIKAISERKVRLAEFECLWKSKKDHWGYTGHHWITQCGRRLNQSRGYLYCPYCGGMIVWYDRLGRPE